MEDINIIATVKSDSSIGVTVSTENTIVPIIKDSGPQGPKRC